MNKFLVGLISVVAVVSIIGNVLMYKRYSSARPLITVNGQVIHRKDLDDRLDYLYTDNVLRQMIISSVITQAAQKAGCMPTDKEVADAKTEIERSDPQVIATAKRTDPTLTLFDEQLATNLALRNLRVKGTSVSDAEARAFYAAHQAQFRLPRQEHTVLVIAQDSIAANDAQRLLLNGVSPQVIASQSNLRVIGINAPAINGLPPAITQTVMSMQKGQVHIFPVGKNFVIVKVDTVAPAGVPSFESIQPQVMLAAKLAKAPPANQTVAKLIEAAQIKVESDKYGAAVPQIQQAGSAPAAQ